MTTLEKLSLWQKEQAASEGVEAYRIVPFGVLKAVAQSIPATKADLLLIKGMGPAKIAKYGEDILTICGSAMPAIGRGVSDKQSKGAERKQAHLVVDQKTGEVVRDTQNTRDTDKIKRELTRSEVGGAEKEGRNAINVGDFLGQLNQVMGSYFGSVRIRGEVIGFKRNQNGHVYFELKDVEGRGIMRCAVFARSYQLSGVELSDGLEIIVTGKPSHHEQYGFSFIGEHVALAGEGALKAAYEKLKAQIKADGLMDESRKRALPDLPKRIGLITSPTGAAIGDFTTNVGKYGYAIIFASTSVEGDKAVQEILGALERLERENLDLLVITRGGGSLESLQAFNNPNIIKAIANFPVPVVAGIGHEQDETLATLVADRGVSTPTAAANAVRESWDQSVEMLTIYGNKIISNLEAHIVHKQQEITDGSHKIQMITADLLGRAQSIISDFNHVLDHLEHSIKSKGQSLTNVAVRVEIAYQNTLRTAQMILQSFDDMMTQMAFHIKTTQSTISEHEQSLRRSNPLRLLQKGYSIARGTEGGVVRSIGDVKEGGFVEIQVADGKIKATVAKK